MNKSKKEHYYMNNIKKKEHYYMNKSKKEHYYMNKSKKEHYYMNNIKKKEHFIIDKYLNIFDPNNFTNIIDQNYKNLITNELINIQKILLFLQIDEEKNKLIMDFDELTIEQLLRELQLKYSYINNGSFNVSDLISKRKLFNNYDRSNPVFKLLNPLLYFDNYTLDELVLFREFFKFNNNIVLQHKNLLLSTSLKLTYINFLCDIYNIKEKYISIENIIQYYVNYNNPIINDETYMKLKILEKLNNMSFITNISSSITNDNYVNQLLSILESVKKKLLIQFIIDDRDSLLNTYDSQTLENLLDDYYEITNEITQIQPIINSEKLIKTKQSFINKGGAEDDNDDSNNDTGNDIGDMDTGDDTGIMDVDNEDDYIMDENIEDSVQVKNVQIWIENIQDIRIVIKYMNPTYNIYNFTYDEILFFYGYILYNSYSILIKYDMKIHNNYILKNSNILWILYIYKMAFNTNTLDNIAVHAFSKI
jgi:hypothetical protein